MSIDPAPSLRLQAVLKQLANQGLLQQQVAFRANVPPQYLSDIKAGRRPMTELFARRIGDEFGVDFHWLLTGQGSMTAVRVDIPPLFAQPVLLLPMLDEPVRGDPQKSRTWNGTLFPVTGAAKSAAEHAVDPYILRIAKSDLRGRLQRGDLVLVSQQANHEGSVAIVIQRGRMKLACRAQSSRWTSLDARKPIAAEADVVGAVVAIIWAPI